MALAPGTALRMYGAVESLQPLLAYRELFAAATPSTLATALP